MIHDHIMNFKLDFDIDGAENSFLIQKLNSRTERPDWLDKDDDDIVASYLEQEWLQSEDEGRLDWPQNGDATYLVGAFARLVTTLQGFPDVSAVNNASLNRWDSPRGYRISPGAGSIHRTVSANSPFNRKNANHAKTHLAVSKRKETELSSSAAMNQNLGLDPLVSRFSARITSTGFLDPCLTDSCVIQVDFDRFFDSDPLNQTDFVVWANIGTHHFPRAEDAPFTLLTEARAGLLLSPFNFLDDDLSGEFSNSVLVRLYPNMRVKLHDKLIWRSSLASQIQSTKAIEHILKSTAGLKALVHRSTR